MCKGGVAEFDKAIQRNFCHVGNYRVNIFVLRGHYVCFRMKSRAESRRHGKTASWHAHGHPILHPGSLSPQLRCVEGVQRRRVQSWTAGSSASHLTLLDAGGQIVSISVCSRGLVVTKVASWGPGAKWGDLDYDWIVTISCPVRDIRSYRTIS